MFHSKLSKHYLFDNATMQVKLNISIEISNESIYAFGVFSPHYRSPHWRTRKNSTRIVVSDEKNPLEIHSK